MKKEILLLFLFIGVYQSGITQSPQLTYERIGVDKGFPSLVVFSMLKDARGFMWFGTKEGLVRYDGVEYKMYYPDESRADGLQEGYVYSLFEDSQQRIWLAAGAGKAYGTIQMFDPVTEKFIRLNIRSWTWSHFDQLVAQNHFLEDQEGKIWLKCSESGIYKIEEREPYRFDVTNYGDLSVTTMFLDTQENFWVGAKSGLYRFNPSRGKLAAVPGQEMWGMVTGIVEDQSGRLWVNYALRGLYEFDPTRDAFTEKWRETNVVKMSANQRYPLVDSLDNIWMIKQYKLEGYSALDRYSIATGEYVRYFDQKSLNFLTFQVDHEGKVWALSNEGMHHFVPEKDEFEAVTDLTGSPYRLYVDRQNNVWISDLEVGMRKYHYSELSIHRLSDQFTNSCLEDELGNIYVADEDGIFSQRGEVPEEKRRQYIRAEECGNLFRDREGRIWATCGSRGTLEALRITPSTQQLRRFKLSPTLYGIDKIMEVSDEQLMLSTIRNGVLTLNKETGDIQFYRHNQKDTTTISSNYLVHILTDSQDEVWVCTQQGIDRFNAPRGNFTRVDPTIYEKYRHIQNFHSSYWKGQFWIGSEVGLQLYEAKTGTVLRSFPITEGYPTQYISDIIPDQKGNLWIASLSNGLVYFDTGKETFQVFNSDIGLPSTRITTGYVRDNGNLILGSDQGSFIIDPDQLLAHTQLPQPVFTKLRVLNNDVGVDGKILKKSIVYSDKIVLGYKENDLSLRYSSLSFTNPAQNQFAYFLQGFDQDWNYVGNQNYANYSDLPPGNYVFHLKASSSAGVWNQAPSRLSIIVSPPWWKTYAFGITKESKGILWWDVISVYLIAILALGINFLAFAYKLKKRRKKHRAIHLSRMNDFKSRFYTNIAHEFRTPLTIILGMTEQDDRQYYQSKSLVKRNALNLLQLVNQLLDLSKVEAGMMGVQLRQGDIIPYLRYITESFHSLADQKYILLHFRSEVPELIMDYDADKLLNIVSNLLSNAIKFTPRGGHVSLLVSRVQVKDTSLFQLRVTDTGVGISENQLPYIFDRFYQTDSSTTRMGEGTGVGLSLTQELIKLLGGRIRVKSTQWQGSEFTVELPIACTAPPAEETKALPPIDVAEPPPEISERWVSSDKRRKQPLALLVEDNPDVVYYLRLCLQQHYTLQVAQNGHEGMEKARSQLPDIIISDVMMPGMDMPSMDMPGMDGYELCQKLKQEVATSHIPIILLTAKAGEEDKLKGLEMGADAYLTKPFNQSELLLRIRNLVRHRQRLWQQVREADHHPSEDLAISSADQRFLQRAYAVVEAHKSNASFRTEDLRKELAVSRTLLHVKLKALTGQSATAFVRTYRLKYAAQLLKQQYGNIAEVAYEAGFSDQSYFTKVFRKHYGRPPSEYAESREA